MEKQKNAVGRRKEAVTRVFLSKGDGKITINGKDYKNYFQLVYLQNQEEASSSANVNIISRWFLVHSYYELKTLLRTIFKNYFNNKQWKIILPYNNSF